MQDAGSDFRLKRSMTMPPHIRQIGPKNGLPMPAHLDRFIRELEALGGELGWYSPSFSPYPILITRADLDEFQRLRLLLNTAIRGIVKTYLGDKRIREIIQLPPDLCEILETMAKRPYRIGSFRPDLLLDQTGQWRICEINARFPLNGYMVSTYINSFIANLDYLAQNESAIPGLEQLIDQGLSRLGSRVTLVKDLDLGKEIHLFISELQRRGIFCQQCSPEELQVTAGQLTVCGEPAGSLIWEVKREELRKLPSAVVEVLAHDTPYFNDLRTQILVHDKRLLAVLQSEEIVKSFLDRDDLSFLRRFLIPTWNAAEPTIQDNLRTDPKRWLLKPNSSGRGKGILVGRSCLGDTWLQGLKNCREYTAQYFLPQQEIPITAFEGGRPVTRNLNLVAMLPGFDETLMGPGFFRASDEELINLHGAGGSLVPAVCAL